MPEPKGGRVSKAAAPNEKTGQKRNGRFPVHHFCCDVGSGGRLGPPAGPALEVWGNTQEETCRDAFRLGVRCVAPFCGPSAPLFLSGSFALVVAWTRTAETDFAVLLLQARRQEARSSAGSQTRLRQPARREKGERGEKTKRASRLHFLPPLPPIRPRCREGNQKGSEERQRNSTPGEMGERRFFRLRKPNCLSGVGRHRRQNSRESRQAPPPSPLSLGTCECRGHSRR